MNSQAWTTIKTFSKALGTFGTIISVLDVGHTVVITFRNRESMGDFISTIPSILWKHKLDLLNIALALCPVGTILKYILDCLPDWEIFSRLRQLFPPALQPLLLPLPPPQFSFPGSGSMLKLAEYEVKVGKILLESYSLLP